MDVQTRNGLIETLEEALGSVNSAQDSVNSYSWDDQDSEVCEASNDAYMRLGDAQKYLRRVRDALQGIQPSLNEDALLSVSQQLGTVRDAVYAAQSEWNTGRSVHLQRMLNEALAILDGTS
jgi:anthranilate phosphoribosyltransferase